MILKIKTKAGVMLYAVLLSALFLLLLQFYVSQVISYQKQAKALLDNSKAYMMAEFVKGKKDESGSLEFSEGSVAYETEGSLRIVKVKLNHQAVYTFTFYRPELSNTDNEKIRNDGEISTEIKES